MRRLTWEESPDAEVNLTPLLDVVFVVLIMFIVVVPILELDKVALAPGKSEQTIGVHDRSPVAVHIRSDGTIWLGRRQVGVERLPEVMGVLHTKFPGEAPQLFCDKRAPFGTYQIVKNAVEAAGYEELDVVLEPA